MAAPMLLFVTRSPWPLLISIGLTVAIGIGSFATRADRTTPEPSASAPDHVDGPAYVAIGDSFTAGGAIGELQPGTGGCLRSTRNYPSLVARSLDYVLTDVSCFGATTRDVLRGEGDVPAQVSAIDAKTSLVTVSIGGNDFGIYTSLLLTCMRTSKPDLPGAPCRTALASRLANETSSIAARVGDVLDAVRKRAPKAKLLVTTYVRLMPPDGTCSAIPFSAADIAWFGRVEKTLADAMTTAARNRELPVIDMYSRSRGHDVCAGPKAWVNGPRPKDRDGILFHPNGAGEKAVAEAVKDELGS
jgi:lysophospholipase L1-like esterase